MAETAKLMNDAGNAVDQDDPPQRLVLLKFIKYDLFRDGDVADGDLVFTYPEDACW